MEALTVADDQSFCTDLPDPPPLDATGISCVVAELPDPIPCGDYLLSVEGDVPLASCADGKPEALVFQYTGESCDATTNPQEGKFECEFDPNFEAPVQVVCDDGDCTVDPSDASIGLGGTVTLFSSGNRFPSDTDFQILDANGVLLQDLRIHASCSKDLNVGDQFGAMVLTGFIPEGSGVMKTFSEYDLTICAVAGPQGPQGKIGETGAQGVQGKIGETGVQGVQGKIGETGAQGVQGKIGETGAQGTQGKIGDTGDQGVQGKIGETGAQGTQGKIGETGAQGVQGKIGGTGAQGT
ncbi:MAG: collagen-like protein, partial [Gammaproteobacteria bacterium]|nr:collagen-like protein [Gammaproteobacteria bacterium]